MDGTRCETVSHTAVRPSWVIFGDWKGPFLGRWKVTHDPERPVTRSSTHLLGVVGGDGPLDLRCPSELDRGFGPGRNPTMLASQNSVMRSLVTAISWDETPLPSGLH